MASSSSSSLPVPDLAFISSQPTSPKRRLPLSRLSFSSSNQLNKFALRLRIGPIRASYLKEESLEIEERESQLLKELNGNGASSSTSDYGANGNGLYTNGSVSALESEKEGSSNGSLVKYVNGNGVVDADIVVEEKPKVSEEGRKKRIEDIGKEEVWFKQAGQDQVQVFFFLFFFNKKGSFICLKSYFWKLQNLIFTVYGCFAGFCCSWRTLE